MESGFIMKKYSKYIKWVLMVIGAIRFRMFGAFAGFFLGIFIEEVLDGFESNWDNKDSTSRTASFKISDYQKQLLALTGAMLRTNKLITKNQSYFILKYFYRQFGTRNGKALFALLKEQVQNPIDYIPAAQALKGKHREAKLQIIRFLYGLCKVDRAMHASEKKILENIAKNIGMSEYDFKKIISDSHSRRKTYHYQPTSKRALSSHYFTLGVQEGAGADELKKAYRKLVLKFHPDKTKLAPELAAEKFQEVQEAYDFIRASKGIK